MATTVKNATLTVNIKEEITLNGSRQDSENILRISDINEIFKRVVSCAASQTTTIASFATNAYDSVQALDVNDVKYIRITNLDASNSLTLSLQIEVGEDDSGADTSASILLEAGKSFIMGSGHDGVSVSDANANLVTDLVDLDSLVVQPGSNIVDVEVFVAIA